MSSGCSLDIWPPVTPSELRRLARESLARDLAWIVDETVLLCQDLKHGIEDCYALLAPIDPGSTLVMSTHRNEKVKGTITRVGTRIVKGTLHLQLRTMPAHSITVAQPIHIAALDSIHTYLTQAIDLLGLTVSSSRPPEPPSLASTLALLTECLSESITLLQGVPPSSNTTTNNHKNSSSSSSSRNSPAPPSSSSTSPAAAAAVSNNSSDTTWTTASCPAHHFSPAPPNISVHLALQESSIVVHLRALESADAPVNFGLKLGLAIGTVRRLEHDEMDTVFRYNPDGDGSCEPKLQQQQQQKQRQQQQQLSGKKERLDQVYVREKVKVESADPSLIALHAKLAYLSHMLGQARHNLAAVMDVNLDDADS